MNIQKAAVRASNNAMRGYIPHNAIVSQGAKIAARQQAQEKPQRGKKGRKRERLTEISTGSGKPVLKQNVGVVRAAKKLFEYEETGLSPYEVRALIERGKGIDRKGEENAGLVKEGAGMDREKCIICGKTLPEDGQGICADCLAEKSDEETAEELRDIAGVLSITADTDANIKKSMEAIMRIAYRIDRRKEK